MCGILALLANESQEVPQNLLNLSLRMMNHRGPDAIGAILRHNLYLGATRLSHRDLSSKANLPLLDKDSGSILCFNGEIVNDDSLRNELKAIGHQFETSSDSEVILKGYLEWGSLIFSKLRGMFAIVLWDSSKQKLVIARDWFGIKPLFFAKSLNGILFASEIKPIAPFLPLSLNQKRLAEYFTFGYIAPPETLFSEVFHFPKGHFLEIEKANQHFHFTKIIPVEDKQSLVQLIDRNIKGYCHSDRIIGVQLSGGIDSTFISSLARPYFNQLQSFGVNVPDVLNSERTYQEEASKAFETDHRILDASSKKFFEILPLTTKALEIPIHHHANVYLFQLFKEASMTCRGLLTGEGGDEFFVGYKRYDLDPKRVKLAFLEHKEMTIRMQKIYPLMRQVYLSPERIHRLTPELSKHYPERAHLLFENDGTHFVENLIEHDQVFGLDSLLLRQDRLGMAFSLENRPPLVDPDIANILSNMTFNEKKGKIFLKNKLRNKMNEQFIDRKKKGFGIPLFEMLSSIEGKEAIEKSIYQSNSLKEIVSKIGIDFEINRFQHRDIESSKYIMRMIYFDTWMREVLTPYQSLYKS